MKIIDYDKTLNKKKIADSAYKICGNANFPVEYQDVYNHLFENDKLILKLLLDKENNLAGFGVFENYELLLNKEIITMLYLSGMVIDPKYQGKNISKEIIKNAYSKLQTDLITLRTQNIAMAKSLLDVFDDNLYAFPSEINNLMLSCLRKSEPFRNINEYGVIKNCYSNQLYYNLNAIKDNFGITLQETDALGVIIEPSKNKKRVLSIFK